MTSARAKKRISECPCCHSKDIPKLLQLVTDWGYENFIECVNCGIIYRDLTTDK